MTVEIKTDAVNMVLLVEDSDDVSILKATFDNIIHKAEKVIESKSLTQPNHP